MTGKRILLTLNQEVYETLKKKADANLMTLQELITDTLRKSILTAKKGKQKGQFIDYFSRRR